MLRFSVGSLLAVKRLKIELLVVLTKMLTLSRKKIKLKNFFWRQQEKDIIREP